LSLKHSDITRVQQGDAVHWQVETL